MLYKSNILKTDMKDRLKFMKEMCFDELDIERLSDLFIHYKGN